MHSKARFGLVAAVLLSCALAACANLNPLSVAETADQRYAAIKLTYDALLTPAVQLIEDDTAPVALRRSLQQAVAQSGDTYRALNTAYVDYLIARETLSGAEREQRLAIVVASLERWITQLEQHIDALASALRR